jgi:Putative DNA-binding domain
MNAVTKLAAVQRKLQSLILQGATAADGFVRSDAGTDAAERLFIYSSAYRSRLQEALAANFPMLQAHLGPQSFATIALEYIGAHPSSYVSIRNFGTHLPHWLETHRSAEPWLHELARFDWALGGAFDAIDATAIGIESLAGIAPVDWPMLSFHFSPAVHRLTLHTNAAGLYMAAANEAPSPAGQVLAEPGDWLISRGALLAQYRSMSRAEALAFDALFAGATFGAACERLSDLEEAESVPMLAASFLKRWIMDEIIVDLVVRRD